MHLAFTEEQDELRAAIRSVLTKECPASLPRSIVEGYRRHGAVIRAWMEDHARDGGLRELADASFARVVEDLGRRVDTAALGPLGPVALMALLERYAYFTISRDLAADRDTLRSVATLIERGFLAKA